MHMQLVTKFKTALSILAVLACLGLCLYAGLEWSQLRQLGCSPHGLLSSSSLPRDHSLDDSKVP